MVGLLNGCVAVGEFSAWGDGLSVTVVFSPLVQPTASNPKAPANKTIDCLRISNPHRIHFECDVYLRLTNRGMLSFRPNPISFNLPQVKGFSTLLL
jgi:hypothetical protein